MRTTAIRGWCFGAVAGIAGMFGLAAGHGLSVETKALSSGIRGFALRLKPGEDVRSSLLAFVRSERLEAAAVVTCVGSLTDVNVRFANQDKGAARTGHFEILSLVGVLDPDGGHLHLSVADRDGVAWGGHLLDGCKVYTTAEVVLAELVDLKFRREIDKTFGYKELQVFPRRP